MGNIGWPEILTLLGIVVTAGGVYAIPFGIWMFKISSGMRVLDNSLNGEGGLEKRFQMANTENHSAHTEIFNRIGAIDSYSSDTREIVISHAERVTTNEKEIQRLRDRPK